MKPPSLVITGRPGIGKSTLFKHIVDYLKANGVIVGGIIAPEVREGNVRTGFRLVDLLTGEETWLARKGVSGTIKVGSYTVFSRASAFVKSSLERAILSADVVAIDEVGPMELKLEGFREAVEKVINSRKPYILVVHYSLVSSQRNWFFSGRVIEVTVSNREYLRKRIPGEFYNELKPYLGIRENS